ncbi:LytTR family DNA-binding domain-containing protein [Maritimibacter sp. UBA3975]|uniref:LytTR family DNA-binding domain-containing protein n=1 Tax=Maritimibacter sp. UBA3975 TaxID=1946833 RepID=UPI000C09FC88|nr:LytTR family DNA-binding domain-containing protein [Maritimibacter sp. UBA3975]MAM63831.1 hypothetical protein [Maritimibacter sp.]|tara:strand:+ start:104201 stop:105019 length:819 start_codon:yes stop_codon:yes gene_type:complete
MAFKAGQSATRGRDIESVLRGFVLSPVCIGAALCLTLFITVFAPGGLFAQMPVWQRGLIHVFDCAAFLAHSYFVVPPMFRLAFDRGWPVLWVHIAVYVPIALILAVVFAMVEAGTLTASEFFWHAAIVVTWVVLSAVIGLFLFWVFFLPHAGLDVRPEQIWTYHPPTSCGLQEHLSNDARGRVLRMMAENQYVRVFTERGEDLIRLTLSEAERLVPDDAGLRVHRSHWVARDLVSDFRFEGGNPRLTISDGAQLPVSRNRVGDVRALLSLRE